MVINPFARLCATNLRNWWEYFRLKDLQDQELLDERSAIAGLPGQPILAAKQPRAFSGAIGFSVYPRLNSQDINAIPHPVLSSLSAF